MTETARQAPAWTAPAPPEEAPPRGLTGAGLLVVASVVVAGALYLRRTPVAPAHYLLLSILLFTTGAVGVLFRRNALVLFMCVELMLNGANLALVTFARATGRLEGQSVVLFVMIVAAAEVAVGLAIIVAIFRRRLSANVDDVFELRG